jgi:hypothetical protein
MITTRTLRAGQILTASYKGKDIECVVTKGKDGLEFVTDGKTFRSISGAGKHYHGSRSIGGFGFWSLASENGKTPATAMTAKKSSKAAKPKTAKVPAVVAPAATPAKRSHKKSPAAK